ncbi:unnamed protein product [Caenorhabditis angaria]|uniref:Nucleosome assembly protein n=1 Tax=Caenorhabditis angaria TaxID=860376 RepID=A0A9P1N435_9PELO|nr:unnamed protein product [Caenorhabditis angaria]
MAQEIPNIEDMGFPFPQAQPNFELLGALPKNVKRRVCALKKVQLASIDVEAKFYERVHALELEFEALFKPLNEQRKQIVTGEKEPTDAECDVPLLHDTQPDVIDQLYEKSEADSNEKGIKDFWLNVLKGHDLTSDLIQEHDTPILTYLTDITTSTSVDPASFTIKFHFAENPYFKNSVLQKEYFLEIIPQEDSKFDFDGPNVIRVTGDKIEWEDGKNVTKKAVKKKQKKGANAGKFMTKTVKADSFFNFFDPPKSADETNEDEDAETILIAMIRA